MSACAVILVLKHGVAGARDIGAATRAIFKTSSPETRSLLMCIASEGREVDAPSTSCVSTCAASKYQDTRSIVEFGHYGYINYRSHT